ncbi:tRNA epoxyqueuosine(34) reductase QueG [Enterovirga aerilata]|uniref:tRNA epoxyqueuosine(34) reductase QueG n=1 Tax=Enterovirga aerilata TaxID=2730920 RepID=UPI003D27BF8F
MKAQVAERGRALGFDLIRVAAPDAIPEAADRLADWLGAGHQAGMDWMAATPERRASPAGLWPEVRSVVMLGISYAPERDPMAALAERGTAVLATYATRRDYHDVIKGRLKELAGFLAAKAGADVKVFVDTAPVMEKALAAASGLGWVGKHSVIVSREHGSWLLLGAIYTTAELPPDEPETPRCGNCTRCLDICPTAAFPRPHVLDAGRCIAYLTIEHKGHIAPEFREAIGNRVFGCDDCLAVCPWNKFAAAARDARLAARAELSGLSLRDLSRLDDAGFRQLFAGTPIKRTGRDRFIRNVLIAIGNSGDPTLSEEAMRLLADPSPLVRAMAVWAAGRLLPPAEFRRLAAAQEPCEGDADVRAEWRAALGPAAPLEAAA